MAPLLAPGDPLLAACDWDFDADDCLEGFLGRLLSWGLSFGIFSTFFKSVPEDDICSSLFTNLRSNLAKNTKMTVF